MTTLSQYQFMLEFDTNMDAPKLVVSDNSNQHAIRTYTQPLPKSGLPYTLLLWHPPEAPENLTIVPAEPLIRQLLTNWDETVKAAIRAGMSNTATAPAVISKDLGSPAVPSAGAPKNAEPIPAAPKTATLSSVACGTNGPKYWLELTLDTSSGAAVLTVKDTTNPALSSTSSVLLPGSKPPYVIEVAPAAQSSNTLTITPRPASGAFDANVTSGRSVLQFSGSISDHRLITHDDTHYTIRLKNVSEYYIAEDIQIRLVLIPIPTLADGNEPLVIIPTEQRVRCIEPGDEHDVVFSVITRGIRPGDYPLRVHLNYRIVYWDGRQTNTTYSQTLCVQE